MLQIVCYVSLLLSGHPRRVPRPVEQPSPALPYFHNLLLDKRSAVDNKAFSKVLHLADVA